jgi:hypothetical protein
VTGVRQLKADREKCARGGERDQAFQYLDKSFDEHSQSLPLWLLVEPAFAPLVKIPVPRTYSAA